MNESILRQIDRLEKTLKSLLPMKEEDQQRLDKKFRLEFNYNSNHIEGNTLTYGETELLLIFDETRGNHTFREYEEMEAHDVAFALIKEWAGDKEYPLTEMDIKNLNKTILVKPFWKDAITSDGQNTRRQIKVGDYKEQPNSVRLQNGEIFHYASPSETPIKMGELIEWFREEEEKKSLHPVELAALLHYQFVLIHPFDDGNGRISRLLLNYVLLKNGFPPVIIKSEDKKSYLSALHLADIGDTEAFIDYIGAQLIWSLSLGVKAAKGESLDEPGDLDKKLTLLKKSMGVTTEAVVKEKYSERAIAAVFEKSIRPLANAWEAKLQDFDPLFYSRKVLLFVNDIFVEENDLTSLAKGLNTQYSNPIYGKDLLVRRILFQCQAIGLRSLKTENLINGGEIYISFFENVYEITVPNQSTSINKLYDEPLSKEEINILVESVGTFLFNNIEACVKSGQG